MKLSTLDVSKLIFIKDNIYRIKKTNGNSDYYLKLKCSNETCNNYIYRRRVDTKSHPYGYCSPPCIKEHREHIGAYKKYKIGKEYKVDNNHIKVFNGTSWSYKTKFNCAYCNKILYTENATNNINHFCTNKCKSYYHNKLIYEAMDNQDHPNFCYLIGLIAADGCVSNKNEVRIQLKNSDEDVLLKINEIFGGTIRKCKELVPRWTVWSLSNKDFIRCLEKKGITQRKSLTLNMESYFQSLPTKNKWHFLRGCWDGDGYIERRDNPSTGIYSGSLYFIQMVQAFINKECDLQKKIYSTKNKNSDNLCYSLQYTGKKAIPVINKIYGNSKQYLALERKETLAHRFIITEG